MTASSTRPAYDDRVLSTLNADGSRRWLVPKPAPGRWLRARTWLGWTLIAVFVGLPLVPVGGRPAVLFDIGAREFTFFGAVLRPTDTPLLMLFLLAVFLLVFLGTALAGRVWCGWGCPQTVYLELVFRPLERWLAGGQRALEQGRSGTPRRLARWAVFGALSLALAHVFLAWFVGWAQLATWVVHAPGEHPIGFGVVVVTAAAVFLDLGWFREQMCTVVCPYARIQAALLDRRSLVIAYDAGRGEPRGRGQRTALETKAGDCVDCGACVRTCPTGIDIRGGLQMECVACAQCIDACDTIMLRVGKPVGLVRYTSQDRLAGLPGGWLRPRTVLYPLAFLAVVGLLVWHAGRLDVAEVTLLRGVGAPYAVEPGGTVSNQVRVKIENRSDTARSFRLGLAATDADLGFVAPVNPLRVAARHSETTSVFVTARPGAVAGGRRSVGLVIEDGTSFTRTVAFPLLGPRDGRQP